MRVILGVAGSVAAFKAAALASEMVREGWEVRAVLTRGAQRFITALTLEALTGNPVSTDVWDEQSGGPMGHLALARWADIVVVAPASANTIARLALGLADDMLSAVALSYTGTLVLAPAMETHMWRHPALQAHVQLLRVRGATVVGPETGRLASGSEGDGRMAEPAHILDVVSTLVVPTQGLTDKRFLITAGPTFEPIDPVRYIGNRSSGKMGFAVAAEARNRGAHVVLVAGPTTLDAPAGVTIVRVETADEMHNAVLSRVHDCDVVVMAAAISDFRPEQVAAAKQKRSQSLEIVLVPTPDVAAAAAAAAPHALHIGFALETHDLIEQARVKLERKGQRLVVANRISDEHNPFGSDQNQVVFVTQDTTIELPLLTKREVARRLCDEIVIMLRDASPVGNSPCIQ